jgi:cell division protein FtsN
MINIACDKSLFTAHRLKHSHISGEIAKTAIIDLSGSSGWRWYGFLNRRRAILAGAGCCLLLFLMIVALFPQQADRQAVALKAEVKPAVIKQAAKPKVDPLPRTAPGPVEKVNPASVPALPEAEEPAVKPAVMATANPAPEKVLQPAAEMTHSVQVGAFRIREQAQKLAGTLKKKGYPAGILPVTGSKARTWYTVRIGDYPSRDVARQQAEAFTAREKMESAVRPFEKL